MADFFTFYISWRDAIRDLPDDVRLEVYEAAVEYAATGTRPALKPLASVAFNFIKDDIDRQTQRAQELSNKRTTAARQRWNKPMQTDAKNANAQLALQTNANDAIIEENKNKNRIEKENKNSLCGGETAERENLFDEIFLILFLNNRKNPISEARRFYDYYSSQGWCKSGGQKVTDIPALVRQWKCEADGARFFPEIQDFFVAAIDTAPEAERPALAMAIRGARFDGNLFKVTCTRRFVDFIEAKENADKIRLLFHKFLPNKEWKYEQIISL